MVEVAIVGLVGTELGVALKALCSSGNLRLAKEGCEGRELKELGAGTELIAPAPPPPPVKVV